MASSAANGSGQILRRIFRELRPEYTYLGAAFVTQVATSATSLTVPYVTGKLVDASYGKDTVVAELVTSHPVAACGAAISFFAVTGAANLARSTLISVAGERFALRLRSAMVHGAAARETSYLGSTRLTAGDLQTRIVGDVAIVQKSVSSSLKLIRSSLMLAGGIPYLVYISPTLSLGSLMLLPPMAFAARAFGTTMKTRQNLVQKSLSDASSTAGEFASNFRIIRQFGGEKAELERFNTQAKVAAARAIETSTLSGIFDFAVDGVAQAVVVSVVAVGSYQVKTGQLTPGALSQFVMLSLIVANHSWSLSSSYTKLMRGAAAAERIFAICDPPQESNGSLMTKTRDNVGRPSLPVDSFHLFPKSMVSTAFNRFAALKSAYKDETAADSEMYAESETSGRSDNHLEFRNVTFAYDKVSVLENISLQVPSGKIVAISGQSGSGKSTLSMLATRLFDPVSGSVLFEGRDVRDIPDLRSRIAVVDQDHVLLHGSILDNVRYSNRSASLKLVEDALNISCSSDFVAEKGMDLQIGASGLSGGQRQRIAIARAILKVLSDTRCNLLFFDEGLSNLDRYTAQKIWENVIELVRDRGLTLVHVTHQPIGDILDSVDKVIRLDQGRVLEEKLGNRKKK